MTVTLAPQMAQADPDDTSSSSNTKLVTNEPKRSPLDDSFNSDIAFWQDYAFQGNYDGVTIWDISTPRNPQVVSQILCPGGQGDVSVSEDGSLMYVSVDYARTSDSCASESSDSGDPEGWEGIRIFDISNLRNPEYVGAVRTDCGSHTHTLVPGKGKKDFLYVSSYGPSDQFPNCQPPHDSISIIQVPKQRPERARVVAEPVLFADGGAGGTSGCHDITVYPARDVAAGACMGDGILMDISNPRRPKVTERVQDPNFAFWHSATFSNHGTKVVFTDELGGGGAPTCNDAVGPKRGADAIFDVVGRSTELKFRSYFKIPRNQTDNENCVAHNGSLIPVEGKDVMVQAWYQGGISVFDFTDSAQPEEIGYFDRGAISDEYLTLGGSWSAYYYNGHVYSSDIQQGLDVIKVRGQRGARKVTFDVLNAQTQYRYPQRLAELGGQRRSNRAQGDTSDAPVIVPGAPGGAERKLGQHRASGLESARKSERATQPNEADERFAEQMIPHHYQAIVMSRMARERHADDELLALADRIRVEQDLEIKGMQGWQARNGLSVTEEREAYRAMMKNPAMLERMGMATRQEIRALRESEGPAFDERFLDLMIPHHEGAIRMAEDVSVDGQDLFFRQMAADLIAAQGQQISVMKEIGGN